MLRLEGLKLPLEAEQEQLKTKAAAVLRCDSANGYWVAERP